jgi:putative transposase
VGVQPPAEQKVVTPGRDTGFIMLGQGLYPCPHSTMKRYMVHRGVYNVYFSTSTIADWLPVFATDKYFSIIVKSLRYCQIHKGLNIVAYVIMPEHIHMVTSNPEEGSLSDIMRDFKRFTSNEITRKLERDNKASLLDVLQKSAVKGKGNTEYKVWQDGFHPEAIHSETFLRQKVEYIHYNPVRRGLVSTPEEWRYSSARNYLSNDETIIKVDMFLEKAFG